MTQSPGADPWALEKNSRSLAARNFGLAKDAVVQLGGGLATIVGGGVIGAWIAPSGWIVPAGLGPGLLAAVPVAIGGTVYRNVTGRKKIQAEFTRRRLALPTTLAPGQSTTGSLFFPITPGPRTLSIEYRSDENTRKLDFDLTPLAGLHLKTPVSQAIPNGAVPAK